MKAYEINITTESDYFFHMALSSDEYFVIKKFIDKANDSSVPWGANFEIEEVEVDELTSSKEIEEKWREQQKRKGISTKSAEVSKLIQEGIKTVFENATKKSGE